MIVKEKSGFILNSEHLPIRYDIYEGKRPTNDGMPVVVFVHGFKGAKDWGAFPEAMRLIAKQGYACVGINLSHCGTDGSVDFFNRLDLFSTQTLGQDHADIEHIVEQISSGKLKGEFPWDVSQIAIIGHSKGGHSAVVAAARIPQIRCLITWAAVANYLNHWNSDIVSDWRKQSMTFVENGRTKQIMPLSKDIYTEALQNKGLLIATTQASKLSIPSLYIHGSEDESVPSFNAEMLYEATESSEKELIFVEGAGHTFGQAHPHKEKITTHFSKVLEHTISWLNSHLLP